MKHIIVGGGLSGLYAAYRLAQMGQDYEVLEASDHWGGRAAGFGIKEEHALELGATWVWEDFQPDLIQLINDLGLKTFDHPTGRFIYDSQEQGIQVFNRPYSQGQRLVGGLSKLIEALVARLDATKLHLNQKVEGLTLKGKVLVQTQDHTFIGDKVLLALPPRIVAQLNFVPALPQDLLEDWQEQETWMAPHAKFVYHFKSPFWRDQDLTGDGISDHGVMMEFHDISDEAGTFGALFGFSALDARSRAQYSQNQLLEAGLMQLEGYFGPRVRSELLNMTLKDWSLDDLVATEADQLAQGHQFRSAKSQASGSWQYQLTGIASEFSPQFPGYLAGAVEAVDLALARM